MDAIRTIVPILFRPRAGVRLGFGLGEVEVRRIGRRDAPIAVRSDVTPVGCREPVTQEFRAWGGGLWHQGYGNLGHLTAPGDVVQGRLKHEEASNSDRLRNWVQSHPLQHDRMDWNRVAGFRQDFAEFESFHRALAAVRVKASNSLVIGDDLWTSSPGPLLEVEVGTIMHPRHARTRHVQGDRRFVIASERRYSAFDRSAVEDAYRAQGLEIRADDERLQVLERGDWLVEDMVDRAMAMEVVMAAWGTIQDDGRARATEIAVDALTAQLALREGLEGLTRDHDVHPPLKEGDPGIVPSAFRTKDVVPLVEGLRKWVGARHPKLPASELGWQAFLGEAERVQDRRGALDDLRGFAL